MTWVYHFQSSTTDSLQKHLTSKTTFDKISQPIQALDDKERRPSVETCTGYQYGQITFSHN